MTRARYWAVLLAVTLVGACASPGGGASTDNDLNRCAAVLPQAREVVHAHGTLTLVRPVNHGQIDMIIRDAGGAPPTTGHPATAHRTPAGPHVPASATAKLCLVVYRGDFDAATIPGAEPAGAHGEYVLIVLRVRHPAVMRVLITDTVPPVARRPWWHL